MNTPNLPTVVTLVVTYRAMRPTRVQERWRTEFDFPGLGGPCDVAMTLLDELSGERRTAVVIGHDSDRVGLVELSVRAMCMARWKLPALLNVEPSAYQWDRVDLAITSHGHTPFDSHWLRLAIDAAGREHLTVHWDDHGHVGRAQRARRHGDLDPAMLIAGEALAGSWHLGDPLQSAGASGHAGSARRPLCRATAPR